MKVKLLKKVVIKPDEEKRKNQLTMKRMMKEIRENDKKENSYRER